MTYAERLPDHAEMLRYAPVDLARYVGAVEAERDRYRKTLEWISGRESGIWGVEAHKALHPELHPEEASDVG